MLILQIDIVNFQVTICILMWYKVSGILFLFLTAQKAKRASLIKNLYDDSFQNRSNFTVSTMEQDKSIIVEVPSSQGATEASYILTLQQEIKTLKRKIDDQMDSQGDILSERATHIEEKMQLQKLIHDNDAEIQRLKSQHLLQIQAIKNDLLRKDEELNNLQRLKEEASNMVVDLKTQIQSSEMEMNNLKETNANHSELIAGYCDQIANMKTINSNLLQEVSYKSNIVDEKTSIIENLKAEKKWLQDKVVNYEREIAESKDREILMTEDLERLKVSVTQQTNNCEQLNKVFMKALHLYKEVV